MSLALSIEVTISEFQWSRGLTFESDKPQVVLARVLLTFEFD